MGNGRRTTYTYDAADRLMATGGVSYGYDNNGNQTSRGADTYAWDAENRMTSATAGGTTTTLAYRGDSLRDSLTSGGNTTTFTWDIAGKMPQVLDDGAFKYVYGAGRIAEVGPGTTTHYYLPVGLGSTMALGRYSRGLGQHLHDACEATKRSDGGAALAGCVPVRGVGSGAGGLVLYRALQESPGEQQLRYQLLGHRPAE